MTVESKTYLSAVYSYSKYSSVINGYLRSSVKEVIPELENMISNLKQELISLTPSTPSITYRGQYDHQAPVGFISTSKELEIAEVFGSVITKFWGYGAYIAPHSAYPHEEEVLYPPCVWINIQGTYVPEDLVEEYLSTQEA